MYVIEDTQENICKHEVLAFVHMLKKYGIFQKFLEERYTKPHWHFKDNAYAEAGLRNPVPVCERINFFYKDMSNFIKRRLKYYSPVAAGTLISFFDVSRVGFSWDETVEGWDFWDQAYCDMTTDERFCYFGIRAFRYKQVKENNNGKE